MTDSIAFAALSLFELMNQPLIHIVDGFEHIQTVANSFRRIQEYLLSDEREDYRITPATRSPSSETSSTSDEKYEITVKEKPVTISMLELEESQMAATIKDASTGYEEESAILKNLNLDIPRGQTTMIFGPANQVTG